MSKLSHIEDIERRDGERETVEAAPEAAPVASASEGLTAEAASSSVDSGLADAQSKAGSSYELPAEEDEEFHGLDSTQPMGALHKTLVVIAVVVVAIAILYIVNSWAHFF